MAYSAYAVANAFVRRAQEGRLHGLTPMKLQKLMYFAQAWHLRVLRQPLLDDTFTRWTYGPVIPAIYHEFKAYGSQPVTQMASTLAMDTGGYRVHVPIIPDDDAQSWSLIDAIVDYYGSSTAASLVELSHSEGSAWAARQPPDDGSAITEAEILADRTIPEMAAAHQHG